MIAQVLQDMSKLRDEEQLPSAFDSATDFSKMTDEEIEEAARQEAGTAEQTMTLDKVNAAGCIYQVLPEGYKMELLDTKHPNPNTPDFIRWLAGRSAAPFGLTEYFATLGSSGQDYKSQSIMTWPAFYEAQKFLEQICDWTIYRWAAWAQRKGIVDMSKLGDGWIRKISWSWPRREDIDEVAQQNAMQSKLRNMTGNYRDYYGADWREKLLQVKREIDWCRENGLPHPAYNLISGGERHESFEKPNDEPSDL